MTWLDITFIVIWVGFLAVGARLGSLWTGACVGGGFLGAFLADYYALPLSEFLGGWAGSSIIATLLLFLLGLAVILIPGWFLSRVSGLLFLGILDSGIGLLTGALTGLVAISLILLYVPPRLPKIEKARAWKKSKVVRPYHALLEDMFNVPHFRPSSIGKKIKKETVKKVKPAASKAAKKIQKAAGDFVEDLKP